jgi:hypothetical protein
VCGVYILYSSFWHYVNVVAKHKRALFLSEFVNGMNNTFRRPVVCVYVEHGGTGMEKKKNEINSQEILTIR